MTKLIPLPSSIEIKELDAFALSYIDNLLIDIGCKNWITFVVRLEQKNGHSTRFIDQKKFIVISDDGKNEEIDNNDINLLRIISRIQKRKRKEKVTIEIIKGDSVQVY